MLKIFHCLLSLFLFLDCTETILICNYTVYFLFLCFWSSWSSLHLYFYSLDQKVVCFIFNLSNIQLSFQTLRCVLYCQPIIAATLQVIVAINILMISLTSICSPICVFILLLNMDHFFNEIKFLFFSDQQSYPTIFPRVPWRVLKHPLGYAYV